MSTTSYTLENALSLARNLIYGPLPKPDDPTPTIAEALKAVEAALLTHKFNWLTGQAARDALRGATEQGTPLILKWPPAWPGDRKTQKRHSPIAIQS